MAYSGRGENDINDNYDSETENMPFITLEPNASIKGINIWYPEQAPDNIVPYRRLFVCTTLKHGARTARE